MATKEKKQGTSIWVDINKKDKTVIASEYTATYEVLDMDGAIVDSGIVQKSQDTLAFELRIDRNTTGSYLGEYIVRVLMVSASGYGEYIYYQRYKFEEI